MGTNGQRKRLKLAIGLAVAAVALGAAMLPATPPPAEIIPPPGAMPVDVSALSVMTYNVQGLPWPIALGRDAQLERIGERLAAYRRAGRQPGIVVLQEAFTDQAKRIGALGGYAHVVTGPGRDAVAAEDSDPAHQAFLRAGSTLFGEGVGKQLDSGLMILSDYPVLAVRQIPFPAHACAGFDCLANKGMVMALVRVPGIASPVAIVATHLNARNASGVDLARAFQAYRWQVEALDGLLRAAQAMRVPVVLAGDLNVGGSEPRRALVEHYAAAWTGGTGRHGVLAACTAKAGCRVDRPADVAESLDRNKDWQVAMPGGGVRLTPASVDVPFGPDADGAMLSDHAGYVVRYRVATGS